MTDSSKLLFNKVQGRPWSVLHWEELFKKRKKYAQEEQGGLLNEETQPNFTTPVSL